MYSTPFPAGALVNETVPDSMITRINDYPFKERPSTLTTNSVQSWHYRPKNLGVRSGDYDTVKYSKIATDREALSQLEIITKGVLSGGIALLEKLSPMEALRQLNDYGEDAWCERLWNDDYENFLGGSYWAFYTTNS